MIFSRNVAIVVANVIILYARTPFPFQINE